MSYAENLYNKIWKTRGSRFIAHKRLERLNELSNYSIAINSIYVIVLSILSLEQFRNLSKLDANHLSLITFFLSILILVISLIENSKDYKIKAESHHRCGKKLSRIYEKLIQIKDKSNDPSIFAKIEELATEYQNIIDEFPYNHSPIDYKKFTLKENIDNKNIFSKKIKLLFLDIEIYFIISASIIAPLLFILIYVINFN
ncbi:SLATT domain-containing protein [Capnocytophaga cynodegmi]|uniref:SMODS and SLOG-associating 2TM effector domain-containing protein n=1 Tax=Capnocytophaga cynodegmi TaxID=28189 RepID=A0A0B7HLW3_9FLAO|nr:SLATT domain-containing protein [Capnocytophaga cynodegmi]CEN35310.1 conserved membrane hypothetical protein [Capnocytophaga cynodegmi]CEN39644.1 conserved membrane hypothetical protein [Capnocytophaga cynodegmi]